MLKQNEYNTEHISDMLCILFCLINIQDVTESGYIKRGYISAVTSCLIHCIIQTPAWG